MTSPQAFEDLCALASRMRDCVGVRDRVYRLRTYKKCFVGSDAVRWLVQQRVADDEAAALALGDQMLCLGLFHHVVYEHTFKNMHLFYRFSADDEAGAASGFATGATTGFPRSLTPPPRRGGGGGGDAADGSPPRVDVSGGSASGASAGGAETIGAGGATWAAGGQQQYRAVVQAQVNALHVRVGALANDLRVAREVQHVLMHEAGSVRDAVARLQQLAEGGGGDAAAAAAASSAEAAAAPQLRLLQRRVEQLHALCLAQLALLVALALAHALAPDAPALPLLVGAAAVAAGAVWWGGGGGGSGGGGGAAGEAAAPVAAAAPQPSATAAPRSGDRVVALHDSSPFARDQRSVGAPPGAPRGPPNQDDASEGDSRQEAAVHTQEQQQLAHATSVVAEGPCAGQAPALEEFGAWPDTPVMLRPHELALNPVAYDGQALVGVEVPFRSELFEGRLVFHVRGVGASAEALFDGKRRLSWLTVQGRFKRPLGLSALTTGQEFGRPFVRLPAAWFVERVLLGVARKISPCMVVGPLTSPYLLTPLIAAAQVVNVSRPGEEPSLTEATEDMRLFDPALADKQGAPLSADARRRHFQHASAREGATFDTQHVWTFGVWQQFVDLGRYELNFAGFTVDCTQHLDGQPLQIMAKDLDSGLYLWNLAVWHEALVGQQSAAPRIGTLLQQL